MNKPYTNVDFKKFLKEKGIKNVKRKDLEEIIEKEGLDVLELAYFHEIYQLVTTKEANNTTKSLTWVIAGLTLITAICTIVGIFN